MAKGLRRTTKGFLVFGKSERYGTITPICVKTNLEDALAFGRGMLSDEPDLEEMKISIRVMPIPLDYYMKDLE